MEEQQQQEEPKPKWMLWTEIAWGVGGVLAVIGLVALLAGCLNLNGGPLLRWPRIQKPEEAGEAPRPKAKPPEPPTCPQCGAWVWDNHEHVCDLDKGHDR